jgi:hypothetical protein
LGDLREAPAKLEGGGKEREQLSGLEARRVEIESVPAAKEKEVVDLREARGKSEAEARVTEEGLLAKVTELESETAKAVGREGGEGASRG